jgi:RecA/RadA recombinase
LPSISREEAKRRENAKAKARQPGYEAPPLANGHDKTLREIAVADWHTLGGVVAQDNLVGGLLGEQQFGMIYGESGSGKSFLTFDMMAHYALGREWMGRKVKGGGVLYIAAEGRGGWSNRVEAFCRHHEIDDETRVMAPFGFVLESVNLGRTGNGDAAAVVRAAEKWTRSRETILDFIVVDTMARATPGANENDAGDMGAFVANMDMIRRNTGATPLTVHHSGKNTAQGARGHSSLRAAMDFEGEVGRTNGGRVLKSRKSRDGEDNAEISFDLKVIEIGTDPDGKVISSCVVVPVEAAAANHKKGRPPKNQQLITTIINQCLHAHGIDYQVPNNGPRVKAVRMEVVKNGYVRRRADLGQNDAERSVRRLIKAMLDAETIVSAVVSGEPYLFWAQKQ